MGIGMLVMSVLSMYFHWRTISAVFCVMSMANFLVLFWVPESPTWLRTKGRKERADRVDKWFDMQQHNSAVVSSVNVIDTGDGCDEIASKPYWSLYIQPTVWKPTLIVILFFVLQQGSGVYVLLCYSMDVIKECRIPWDSVTVSVFLSVSRVVGAVCFASLHRVRRRTLLVISSACMTASLFVVLVYMRIFRNVENPPYPVTPVVAFVVFLFFSMLGIIPMPWSLCGEVFPIAVSGKYFKTITNHIPYTEFKNVNCIGTLGNLMMCSEFWQ